MLKLLGSVATWVAIVIGVAGVAAVLYAWRLPPFSSTIVYTDNAYVKGDVTTLAPQIAGSIIEVPVADYQQVKAGDLLFQIDQRIYQQKLEQAQASLASAKASLSNSEQDRLSAEAKVRSAEASAASAEASMNNTERDWKRVEPLSERGVVSKTFADSSKLSADQARSSYAEAVANLDTSRLALQSVLVKRLSLEADVQSAEAALHLAEIDLQYTRIVAPKDGRLGAIGAHVGQYVTTGTQLTSLVPAEFWVVANFKETELPGMQVGQPAAMTVDALNHAALKGHVERFSPATGSEFSVIRPDNATGNFTKVAQRIPVRIRIDPDQAARDSLAPGMSVVVTIDTASKSESTAVRQ